MTTYYYNPDASGANNGTSEADGWTAMSSVTSNVAAGDTVYFKNGGSRDGSGANVTFAADGSDTGQIRLKGYTSTVEDTGLFQTSDKFFFNGDNHRIENIDFEGGTTIRPVVTTDGGNNLFQNCKIVSTYTSSNGRTIEVTKEASLVDCYIESTDSNFSVAKIGAVYATSGDSVSMQGCVIRGNVGLGCADPYTGSVLVNDCIFTDATSVGMRAGIEIDVEYNSNGWTWLTNNTFYGFSEEGIRYTQMFSATDHKNHVVMNNIFWGDGSAGSAGIENDDTGQTSTVHFINNAFGNVDTNYLDFASDITDNIGTVSLTSDPFVDGANLDFRLNSTAGGGVLCRAAATPITAFHGTPLTLNRKDLGAVQHSGLIERISVS